MVMSCIICHKTGPRGYFEVPNDYRQEEWLNIAALPPATKVKGKRVCYRHFHLNNFKFFGNGVRLTKGKSLKNLLTFKTVKTCFQH